VSSAVATRVGNVSNVTTSALVSTALTAARASAADVDANSRE
jgi:hypothetical protein